MPTILKMLNDLKEEGFAASAIEKELKFSNGLLGKAAKGKTNLSPEKLLALTTFYNQKTSVTTHPVVKELIEAVDGLTTADKIPPPKKKKNPDVVVETAYGERFFELCRLKKINPEDMLVWIEENYGKKPVALKKVWGKQEKEPKHDGNRYDRRKEKFGF